MKKAELIDMVAEKAEMSRAAAARAVHAIFDSTSGAIADAVRAGENLSIPGFGKFSTRKRGARKGRNPQTGQEIDIPERVVVHFSPGKGLSDASRGGTGSGRKTAAKKSAAAKKSTATKSQAGGSSSAKKSTRKSATAKKSASPGGTARSR